MLRPAPSRQPGANPAADALGARGTEVGHDDDDVAPLGVTFEDGVEAGGAPAADDVKKAAQNRFR
jgi:hypothetical protein